MKSSKERLESLVGKPIILFDSSTQYGIISGLDFSNGYIILSNMPYLNYAEQKVEFGNNVLIQMTGKNIVPITKKQLEAYANDFGKDFQYLGKFVEIDSKFGKLASVQSSDYELKPALVKTAGKYHWENELSVFVPKSQTARITPVLKTDLDDLVHIQNSMEDLSRAELNRRYAEIDSKPSKQKELTFPSRRV